VIVISMLLVIVGAVTLVIGAFLRDDLFLVYVSIASCLAAGLFLVIGIIRSRPSRKPVLASGGDGQDASWSGASSWSGDGRDSGGDAGAAAAGTQVLDRDEGADEGVTAEEPTAAPALPPDAPSGADERWQPQPAEAEPAPTEGSGATVMEAPDEADAAAPTPEQPEQDAPAAAKVAKTAKKAGAKKPTAEGLPAGFEVLSEVSGVGPAKQRAIAARFGTVEALRAADTDDLAAVPGISETLARRIHDHLQF
jgi:hypothetical protein